MTPSRVIHSSAITLRISAPSGRWIAPTGSDGAAPRDSPCAEDALPHAVPPGAREASSRVNRSGRDGPCSTPQARPRLLHVHPVQAQEVLAQDLALGLLGELRVAVALDQVLGQLEVPEGVQ